MTRNLKNYKNIKNRDLITYVVLVVIRVVFVFIPQYGYIHPDEFFQTTEIVSGKFCKIFFYLDLDISIIFYFHYLSRRNFRTGSIKDLGVQQHHAHSLLRNTIPVSQNSYDDFQNNFNVLEIALQY